MVVLLVGCGSSAPPVTPPSPADAALGPDAATVAPDGGPAVADASAEAPAGTCGSMTFGEAVVPDVLLVFDRSAASTDHTRAASALVDVVNRTAGSVRWGLLLYPSRDTACTVEAVPALPLGQTSSSMAQALMAAPPGTTAGAPLAAAVTAAQQYLDATSLAENRFLVVVSAGQPSCAGNGPAEAIAAVTAAAQDGIASFVVASATPASDDTLQRLSAAGGKPRAGTPSYHSIADEAELADALTSTGSGVSSCLLPLDAPPPAPANVRVDVKGQRLTRDPTHADGWDYGPGMQSIAFYGVACSTVKTAHAGEVQVFFGCPGGPTL
jgi:hypothetical protein